ncbi:MAG: AmmeMemoRadiSam system protein A [Desulfurivibrionaceae bacterium]|nr:AmmeMemoRadiSam system protein A [Desulfurivibrionaceae bacterium]
MANRLDEEQGRVLLDAARKAIMEKLHLPVPTEKRQTAGDVARDPVFLEKQGVFVTLHLEGRLRGCIGSLVGTRPLIDGVRENAVNAACNDYRFEPVPPGELDEIDIEVSVLSEPQPLRYDDVDDLVSRLRPFIDGVIIRKAGATATFLPQVWEQLPDVAEFLSHLCLKAGLSADEWRRGDLAVSTYQVQSFAELGHQA